MTVIEMETCQSIKSAARKFSESLGFSEYCREYYPEQESVSDAIEKELELGNVRVSSITPIVGDDRFRPTVLVVYRKLNK